RTVPSRPPRWPPRSTTPSALRRQQPCPAPMAGPCCSSTLSRSANCSAEHFQTGTLLDNLLPRPENAVEECAVGPSADEGGRVRRRPNGSFPRGAEVTVI